MPAIYRGKEFMIGTCKVRKNSFAVWQRDSWEVFGIDRIGCEQVLERFHKRNKAARFARALNDRI